MTYLYYVGFFATNKKATQHGPGSIVIKRTEPIKTHKDIEELAKDIKKAKKYSAVTILSWTEIEE